jgi:hypothetical protein
LNIVFCSTLIFIDIIIIIIVAPDIAAAHKIIRDYGKRTDIWHLVLLGKMSCLRSRHLVLWSLGTLTGQHRFYGMGLVT